MHNVRISNFNVGEPVAQWLKHAYRGMTFTGAREQFWPDAPPAATSDSYRYQWELNRGSLGASLLHQTLSHGCSFYLCTNQKRINKRIILLL